MPANVGATSATYGGVISMGCHGAATSSRTLPDLVTEVKIIDSNGTLHTFSKDREPVEFSAAVLNLGLLGIIYSYTIQVEPMFKLHMTNTYPLARDYFADPKIGGPKIRAMVLDNFMTNIAYRPFGGDNLDSSMDRVWIQEWRRTDMNLTEIPAPDNLQSILQDLRAAIGYKLGQFIVANPSSTPLILHLAHALLGKQADLVQHVPSAIHFIGGEDFFQHVNMGFAFKADINFENVVNASKYVIDLIYEYALRGIFPLNIALELRFVKSSGMIMSHAYDEDPDAIYCMIEIQSFKDTPGFDEFSIAVAQYWMDSFGARPHWAKLWEHVPGIIPYLQQNVGVRFDIFDAVRKKYDPEGIHNQAI
ncbi:hypothetical protein BGZ72_003689 [Mortierella alpina]|nr:hypothetical protein BGZ72_003689 [Mortierella alpina]